MGFTDRRAAGRALGRALMGRLGDRPVVVALPRGGVPVAFEVAAALGAPLDVIVVRKLGVPFQPELAMGAIGEGGVLVLDPDLVRRAGVSERELDAVEASQRTELQRQASRFREGRPRVDLTGATAVVVDDGIATGSTARASCRVARALGARRVVVAVPVAPPDALDGLLGDADEVVALETPEPFGAVGAFYRDFSQVSDAEVVELLEAARRERPGDAPPLPEP